MVQGCLGNRPHQDRLCLYLGVEMLKMSDFGVASRQPLSP